MKIEELKQMMDKGTFHHATYRDVGSLWEGLWIYERDLEGCRGFSCAGAFLKDSVDLSAAQELVRGTGISVGAYGQG